MSSSPMLHRSGSGGRGPGQRVVGEDEEDAGDLEDVVVLGVARVVELLVVLLPPGDEEPLRWIPLSLDAHGGSPLPKASGTHTFSPPFLLCETEHPNLTVFGYWHLDLF